MSKPKPDTQIEGGEITSTGAAVDSVEADEPLERLPRILRYALLANRVGSFVHERLVAEISVLAPALRQTSAWANRRDFDTGISLARNLDQLAVTSDLPSLRSLADCVRLLSLPLPNEHTQNDHRRVAKSLLYAEKSLSDQTDATIAADVEAIVCGWAILPLTMNSLLPLRHASAITAAYSVGQDAADRRIAAVQASWSARLEEVLNHRDEPKGIAISEPTTETRELEIVCGEDEIVVCHLSEKPTKRSSLSQALGPHKHIINAPVRLQPVPALRTLRRALLAEFPYAESVIDFALADLIGRKLVLMRPLLLWGEPGSGKSKFARRLGEMLGVGIWRTDASRTDGAEFAGTDRRWNSTEPCHPFLAISRAQRANTIVMLDELEKAGTSTAHGRFWDCMLGFLERETASRYPDPALQCNLDLSHVSYVATANSLDPLPSPLRDRFRITHFPKPKAEHIEALLPALIADAAKARGLDHRWIDPLTGLERDAIATHWTGGSIRQLRRMIDVILLDRERTSVRQ